MSDSFLRNIVAADLARRMESDNDLRLAVAIAAADLISLINTRANLGDDFPCEPTLEAALISSVGSAARILNLVRSKNV